MVIDVSESRIMLRSPIVATISRDDVGMDRFSCSDAATLRPFKDDANYYAFGDFVDGVWNYEQPFDELVEAVGGLSRIDPTRTYLQLLCVRSSTIGESRLLCCIRKAPKVPGDIAEYNTPPIEFIGAGRLEPLISRSCTDIKNLSYVFVKEKSRIRCPFRYCLHQLALGYRCSSRFITSIFFWPFHHLASLKRYTNSVGPVVMDREIQQ